MAIGFALLTISPLHEKEVFESLDKKITEIIEVHPLFGEYDIIVKIKCDSINEIGEIVLKKIRPIKGISDSKTLISTKSLTGED
jgi:DNA-binding Lrp family transcriptional regulator